MKDEDDETTLAVLEDHSKVAVLSSTAAAVLNRSEIEAQLDAAHKYPRSIKDFLNEAITLATFDEETAASCIYTLPRAGKNIPGPSVRLAEICASAYRNLHYGGRSLDAEDNDIVGQGICWDLEKNVRVTIEAKRSVLDKKGRRYTADMINVTGNAAASIALRNAIFRVIPRVYVMKVYDRARETALGKGRSMSEKRAVVMDRLTKMGAPLDRILATAGQRSVEDLTLDHLEVLIGLGSRIKNGEITVDDAFPPLGAASKIPFEKPAGTRLDQIVDLHRRGTPSTPIWETCSQSDFDQLEIACKEHGLRVKDYRVHIQTTMGFASWDLLTKDRLEEVFAWIRARPKAE